MIQNISIGKYFHQKSEGEFKVYLMYISQTVRFYEMSGSIDVLQI